MFMSHWKVSSDFWVLCCLGPAEGEAQTFLSACLPVSRCYSQEHLNTQCAELSDYFAKRCRRLCLVRLNGEQLRFQVLGRRALRWQLLFQQQFWGTTHVRIQRVRWRCDGLAPRLRLASIWLERRSCHCQKFSMYIGSLLYQVHGSLRWTLVLQSTGEEVLTLYHYTDELAFCNVVNLEQTAAQLFASLVDKRAHFGQGLYATQHEPAAARLKCDVERSRVELWSC